MMKFDLTPLLKNGAHKIIIRQALLGAPFVALTFLLGYKDFALALFRGEVIGLLDSVIMFSGIKKALSYADYPEQGVKIMQRYRWYRIISAGSLIVLMLKLKYHVFGVCVGFLLIHIFLIINFLFIAYRLDREET